MPARKPILLSAGLMSLGSVLLTVSSTAQAGYEIKLSDQDKITFGGFIKIDARYVDGDVGYRDF